MVILYLEINVLPHESFERDGKDIYLDIPVSAVDATLGVSVDVPTIHGDVTMKIPAGTQDGTRMRLKGKGTVDLHGGRDGDQIVTVRVTVENHSHVKNVNYTNSYKNYKIPAKVKQPGKSLRRNLCK